MLMDLAAQKEPKLEMAISAFAARTAMLRCVEFPTISFMLIAIITRTALQGDVLGDDPALLSEQDATILGGLFHSQLVRSTSNAAAVQSFLRLTPLRKLMRTQSWFAPMLEAIAEQLSPGLQLGSMKGFGMVQKAAQATAAVSAFSVKSEPSASSVSPSPDPVDGDTCAETNQVTAIHSAGAADSELRICVASVSTRARPTALTIPPDVAGEVKYCADSAQGTAEGRPVPRELAHAASFDNRGATRQP